MPEPTVVTDLTGGHLALMVRLEQYEELVTEFIKARTTRQEPESILPCRDGRNVARAQEIDWSINS